MSEGTLRYSQERGTRMIGIKETLKIDPQLPLAENDSPFLGSLTILLP